jgi:hypothetical protein
MVVRTADVRDKTRLLDMADAWLDLAHHAARLEKRPTRRIADHPWSQRPSAANEALSHKAMDRLSRSRSLRASLAHSLRVGYAASMLAVLSLGLWSKTNANRRRFSFNNRKLGRRIFAAARTQSDREPRQLGLLSRLPDSIDVTPLPSRLLGKTSTVPTRSRVLNCG